LARDLRLLALLERQAKRLARDLKLLALLERQKVGLTALGFPFLTSSLDLHKGWARKLQRLCPIRQENSILLIEMEDSHG
jgi:hypothetical protein